MNVPDARTPARQFLAALVYLALSATTTVAALVFERRDPQGAWVPETLHPQEYDCTAFPSTEFAAQIYMLPTRLGQRSFLEFRLTNNTGTRLTGFRYEVLDHATGFTNSDFFAGGITALNIGQVGSGFISFQPSYSGIPDSQDPAEVVLEISYLVPYVDGNGQNQTVRVYKKVCTEAPVLPNPGIYLTGSTDPATRGIPPIANNEAPGPGESRLNFGIFNNSGPSPTPPKTHYFRLFNTSGSSSLNFLPANGPHLRLVGDPEFSMSGISTTPLAPNSYRDFVITFTPGATTGVRTATFSVYTDDPEDPIFQFSLTATTVAGAALLEMTATGIDDMAPPTLILDNSPLRLPGLTDFDKVDLGTTATLHFDFFNAGFQPITITEVTRADTSAGNPITASLQVVPPVTINARSTSGLDKLSVRMQPTAVGHVTNEIIIRTNAPFPYNEYRFTVYGQAVDLDGPPAAEMAWFSNIGWYVPPTMTSSIGGSINDTLIPVAHRITNIGGGTLTLDPPTVTGQAAAEVTVEGFDSPISLTSGDSFEFLLVADPATTGTRPATVTMASNTGSPFTFTTNVTGVNRAPDRPEIAFPDPTQHQPFFIPGAIPGDGPTSRYMTIQNRGTANLALWSITSDSPFFRIGEHAPRVSAYSGSGDYPSEIVPIVFDPPPNAEQRLYRATITIASTDPDTPELEFEAVSSLVDTSALPYISDVFPGLNPGELRVWWHAPEGAQYYFHQSTSLSGWGNAGPSTYYGNIRGQSATFAAPPGSDRFFVRLNRIPQ